MTKRSTTSPNLPRQTPRQDKTEPPWDTPTTEMQVRQTIPVIGDLEALVGRTATCELSPEELADLQALSRVGGTP